MKYIAIINGVESLLLLPENEKEKEVVAFYRNMGECTVSVIEQNSAVLGIPTSGALLIKKIEKNGKPNDESSSGTK